jgi:hypothetical protein
MCHNVFKDYGVCDSMQTEMQGQEKVGYHKGALSVLTKEREEMMRILQIVESLMQMHVKELKELGVDLSGKKSTEKKNKKNIDEIL